MECYRSNLEHLRDELARLDGLLQARQVRSKATTCNGYDGLFISDEEIDAVQFAKPCSGCVSQEADQKARDARKKIQERCSSTSVSLRLPLLSRRFRLGPLETDILVLALAPELDLRYRKWYAYLQDNVALKAPTVNLALELFCTLPAERALLCQALMPESPLVMGGLLNVGTGGANGSFLESTLTLSDPARRFLLGIDALSPDLAPFCRWISNDVSPDAVPFPEDFQQQLGRLAEIKSSAGVVCMLYGADRHSRVSAAEIVCRQRRVPLLWCDWGTLLESQTSLNSLRCDLQLHGASLFCDDWHRLASETAPAGILSRLVRSVASGVDAPLFLSSRTNGYPLVPLPARFLALRVPSPDAHLRRAMWRRCLGDEGETFDAARLATLSMSQSQIESAVTNAKLAAEVYGTPLREQDLMNAGRELSRPHLISFAKYIRPRRQWTDLILPKDTILQLREFCAQVKNRERVHGEWDFGQRLSTGKGVIALFVGATGTGKTLASEVIANDLGLDLYKVDLASIVSKYIGETEKNLARLFEDAEDSRTLLFFDEADALFGKRSEVKEAHDRYANIEINYLLQRVEDYEGTIILASNLSKNIDPAFLRRLNFSIEFPFPDEEHRRLIWQSVFPAKAPLSSDVDLSLLARNFRIPGGNIKNVAVAAAFQAADNGGLIDMHHVILALKREYQKLGRVCEKSAFEQFYDLVRS